VEAYSEAAEGLIRFLEEEIGDLYRTSCVRCGGDAEAKYFLWVKTAACPACGKTVDLFPGPFLAVRGRHPRDVVVCRWCGELNEIEERRPLPCRSCGRLPDLRPGARRSQARCPHCGQAFRYPDGSGPPAAWPGWPRPGSCCWSRRFKAPFPPARPAGPSPGRTPPPGCARPPCAGPP